MKRCTARLLALTFGATLSVVAPVATAAVTPRTLVLEEFDTPFDPSLWHLSTPVADDAYVGRPKRSLLSVTHTIPTNQPTPPASSSDNALINFTHLWSAGTLGSTLYRRGIVLKFPGPMPVQTCSAASDNMGEAGDPIWVNVYALGTPFSVLSPEGIPVGGGGGKIQFQLVPVVSSWNPYKVDGQRYLVYGVAAMPAPNGDMSEPLPGASTHRVTLGEYTIGSGPLRLAFAANYHQQAILFSMQVGGRPPVQQTIGYDRHAYVREGGPIVQLSVFGDFTTALTIGSRSGRCMLNEPPVKFRVDVDRLFHSL